MSVLLCRFRLGGGMMERLTVDYGKKFSPFRYAMKDGSDAEIGYFKNYDAFYSHMLMVQKLGEYEDLEEQGLLLRLPCGIGADIYFIPSKTNYKLNILQGYPESNRVYHQNVEEIAFTQYGWYLECDKDIEYATGQIFIDKLYKETWFLTQAEAEQKLKEMESD